VSVNKKEKSTWNYQVLLRAERQQRRQVDGVMLMEESKRIIENRTCWSYTTYCFEQG
jgi:hypothetical protein